MQLISEERLRLEELRLKENFEKLVIFSLKKDCQMVLKKVWRSHGMGGRKVEIVDVCKKGRYDNLTPFSVTNMN